MTNESNGSCSTHSTAWTAKVLTQFASWAALTCLLMGSSAARADICLDGLACAAGDVRIASLGLLAGPEGGTCFEGETIDVTLEGNIETGANQRYDFGFFVNTEGGSAGDDATGCYRDYLPVPEYSNFESTDFQDSCGGVAPNSTETREFTLQIECRDFDNDGFVDISACSSWEQGERVICGGIDDVFPGSPAKCSCDDSIQVGEVNPIVVLDPCDPDDNPDAPTCDDENLCTSDLCVNNDGVATCENPADAGQNGNACGDTSTSECSAPDTCNAGVCEPNNAQDGTTCSDGEFCTTGEACQVGLCTGGGATDCSNSLFCDGDEICNEGTDTCDAGTPPACGDGQFCNGDEICDQSTDACVFGTPPSIDDGVICTDDSCDEVNDVVVNTANNANCADGAFCNGDETCDAINDCQLGTPPSIDDGVICTDDSCDEVNDVVVNTANNANCADGAFCNGDETCDAINDCQAGTAPDADDGVVCTDDSCDEANDVVVNTPNDGNCADGAFCNGDETCDAINDCQAGTAPDADDGVVCTDDSCDEANDVVVNTPNDGNCADGAFCNGDETCDAINDCQAGTAPDADDGVVCTDDSCDEANDVVVNTPNDGNCADGAFCNGDETCDAINDCQAGTAPDADDGVVCTDDSCDEANDVVVNTPNDGNCADGAFCNGDETCDAINDCQAGTAPDADDGVVCTDDSCDEANDVVVNTPNDGNCADGAFCNGDETCDAINDCQAGTAPDADDGVVCTDDSCDEANDVVVNTPNDGNCADGAFCNGDETCDAINDCQAGTAPDADDGVVCTDDSCDEANDVVVNTPNDGNCADGAFCNGDETCDAINDCQAGTAPDADDGVVCTDDSCDEANDVVVNTPNDGNCADGAFCNGDETCDAINDCQAGTAPDADDGVVCTDDSCDEANDVVVNTPNDGLCDNGEFCDGSETCDAVNDCQAGTAPDADDGVVCTDDSCDEANDVVVNTPSDANCDDGLFCSGVETCDAINDCQDGADPVITDGVFCTDDSCDEVNDVVVNAANDGNCDLTENDCTEADTCDPVNDCQPNNLACASVTDSALCTFDVSSKGVCSGDGSVCDPLDECIDEDYCSVTGADCSATGTDGVCNSTCSSGTCEPENQFKLVFTPDGKIWPGYKLNASNPGQTFYNLVYVGAPTVLTISIPYPYVTVGGMPIHVYDAADVGNVLSDDCFDPPNETLGEFGTQRTIDDWIADGKHGPNDSGTWPLTVNLSGIDSPSGTYYVNVHLDYGLKGPGLDANPWDLEADRYDAGNPSAWGVADEHGILVGTLVSADAVVNTGDGTDGTGALAIADCTDYKFSHDYPGNTEEFDDTVQNLNIFKRISGAFGNATGSSSGEVAADTVVLLVRTDTDETVATGFTDEDGTYALPYKHKGKRAAYTVELTGDYDLSGEIELKANGFGEVSFDIDTGEVTAIFSEKPGGRKGGNGGGQ